MTRFVCLFTSIFCLWLFSNAQTIEKGTYVGNGTTDFMIVTDDTICYRLQTSFGMVYNTIGIGPYIYKDCLLTVESLEKIYEVTTEVSIVQRKDSLTTFRILDYDGMPMSDVVVTFEEKQMREESFWSRLLKSFKKRTKDKTGLLTTATGSDGFVSEAILTSYIEKQVQVICYDVGLAEMKADIEIEKGHDYVMKSGIPQNIPCGVGTIGTHRFNIRVLEDGTLEHVVTNPSYPRQPDTTYLFLHSKECSIDLNWFRSAKTYHPITSAKTSILKESNRDK